jgi:hypothetical protein
MVDLMRLRDDPPGYNSDEEKAPVSWPPCNERPSTRIMPASLWKRATESTGAETSTTAKDHPTSRLTWVHQEEGALFCEYRGQDTKTAVEKYRYRFFFQKNGAKTNLQYPVTVAIKTKPAGHETAVIDLKRMQQKGSPKRAGAAILHSLADELDGVAHRFCIKNPPMDFASQLDKEPSVSKSKDGYHMQTQDLKRFLERRLELSQ